MHDYTHQATTLHFLLTLNPIHVTHITSLQVWNNILLRPISESATEKRQSGKGTTAYFSPHDYA